MTYRKAWGQIKAMEEQLDLAQGIEEEVDRRFLEVLSAPNTLFSIRLSVITATLAMRRESFWVIPTK